MSYCRWSECDVYAYDSCEGGVRFWVAGNDDLNRLCGTYNEAYQYAKELRDKHGIDVPSHAIDALREDAIDEAKQYLGPDSAVADMLAENAKLRERAVSMLSELRGVVSEGDYDSPSGRYFLLRRDVAAYEDALRELGIEVPE